MRRNFANIACQPGETRHNARVELRGDLRKVSHRIGPLRVRRSQKEAAMSGWKPANRVEGLSVSHSGTAYRRGYP